MAKEQEKSVRLSKALREFGIGLDTAVDFLRSNGVEIEDDQNAKISREAYQLLSKEYGSSVVPAERKQAKQKRKETPQTVGDALGMQQPAATPSTEQPVSQSTSPIEAEKRKATVGPKVVGKINVEAKPAAKPTATKSPASGEAKPAPSPKVAENKVEAEKKVAPTAEALAEKRKETVAVEKKGQEETPAAPKRAASERAKKSEKDPTAAPAKETKASAKSTKKAVTEKEPEKPKVTPQREEKVVDPVSAHKLTGPTFVGKVQLDAQGKLLTPKPERSEKQPVVEEKPEERPAPKEEAQPVVERKLPEEDEIFRPTEVKLEGPKVVGKIELPKLPDRSKRKPEASATPGGGLQKKRRRKRIGQDAAGAPSQGGAQQVPPKSRQQNPTSSRPYRKSRTQRAAEVPQEISMEDVEEKIKQTRARIASKKSSSFAKGAKMRREHRSVMEAKREQEQLRAEQEKKTLSVSEFVTANELAGLMNVSVTDVIEACMNMGQMVSINQRLDAETLTLVADEFGYELEFVEAKIDFDSDEPEDKPEDLRPRPPIFVVLGHVDHGKTTLCDTIRKSNVTEKEAGGITQHLTAFSIAIGDRKATLIDTPGHEAFTAMRARGAELTDVAIIVVSAEDGLMPQTLEAMSQASLQNVRIVFAINKIDSPKADPEKVKEELSQHNYLVEDWGGKYQCQEISAKYNKNVDLLLEKVLLEADIMGLTANPKRRAEALVFESTVDKGRGNVAWILVQNGTLRKGDSIVAGGFYGRVKAMFDDKGKSVTSAGPSTPVQVIGLNGAPQAGDIFKAVKNDKEARDIASKVTNIRRVQEMRSRKHITLDEIGRRILIGNFQELNLIVKGDVDGSVEALSDSLIKLSTEEIQVNVISKGVGQITESDVTMAATANAIIIGFQVRPSGQAKKMADAEQIDIRLYSIIYDAIEEIKSAMEGMLSPEVKEEVTGTAEVQETYRISKVGTIAGALVREGKISRGSKARIIRDGIVVYSSELSSLKRYKDEAKEVVAGMECGIGVKNYNDIKVGDIIEAYVEVEVKRTL